MKSISERFAVSFIPEPNSGCWLWLGIYSGFRKKPEQARAIITHRDKRYNLARISWELYNGFSPGALHVCHKCDNPACVNPDHLFLGTAKDNLLDASRKGRLVRNNRPTHCPVGHLYDEANTRWRKSTTTKLSPVCRACANAYKVKCDADGRTASRIARQNVRKANIRRSDPNFKSNRILTEGDVRFVFRECANGKSQTAVGKELGVTRSTINDIIKGRIWRSVKENP